MYFVKCAMNDKQVMTGEWDDWALRLIISEILHLLDEWFWACPGDIPDKLRQFNPLNPHDALKHHFTSLKTDLIFLQPRVLERKFP